MNGRETPLLPGQRHVILCCDCEGTREQLARVHRIFLRAEVPANFFFVGQTVEEMPDLVRAIARHHQCESHTYSHPNLRRLAHASQREEILRGKRAVENCIGRSTRGFRAPMHCMNRDTVRILNDEGFTFDASRLYFRYDMGKVEELNPTWFREWMPLYEWLRLRPRTAFGLFRRLTLLRTLSVLPVHPQYAGKTPELAKGLLWFIHDARRRGVRFWYIDDWLKETRGVPLPESGPAHPYASYGGAVNGGRVSVPTVETFHRGELPEDHRIGDLPEAPRERTLLR